ncbi:MAG TPA: hypothetical protein VGZ22_16340 [Isosphaeraceae bacterium]|jgi:hypothetical protein|nr:hypothetical protein [Isosphaeraceae bacterium]
MSWILPFLLYYVILFVACYLVTDYGQKYLYDETTPSLALKLIGATAILAIAATYFRPSFDTMFTADILWTCVQAALWFGVFTLILRFQPLHAAAIGIVTMLLVVGIATLALDSLSGNLPEAARTEIRPASKPLRRPSGPVMPSAPPQPDATSGETKPVAPDTNPAAK